MSRWVGIQSEKGDKGCRSLLGLYSLDLPYLLYHSPKGQLWTQYHPPAEDSNFYNELKFPNCSCSACWEVTKTHTDLYLLLFTFCMALHHPMLPPDIWEWEEQLGCLQMPRQIWQDIAIKHLIISTERVSCWAIWVCWNEPLSRKDSMRQQGKKDIQQRRLITDYKDTIDRGKKKAEE